MIYLMYGEEKYLLEKQITKLKKQFHIEDEFGFNTFDCLEDSIENIINEIITPSFFTENKMIIIKNPYFITGIKVNKDISEQNLKPLEEIITKSDDHTIIIFYHISKIDERKAFSKLLKKYAKLYVYDKVDSISLKGTVRAMIKERKASIDKEPLDYLLAKLPDTLDQISNELDKLCLYTSKIEKADIDLVISKKTEDNAFELVNAIVKRDMVKVMHVYQDLMVLNEEPIKLIVLIAGQFRLLYQVKLLSNKGYTDQEIGKILKINPYRIKYLLADLRNHDMNQLTYYLNELSLLDLQIKKGEIDKKLALEVFFMKVGNPNGIVKNII